MQVISTDLWHVICQKNIKHLSTVFTQQDKRTVTVGIDDYEIKKTTNINISLNTRFYVNQSEEEIGNFHCAVVVKIILSEVELAQGNKLKPIIEYAAINRAWPILNRASKQLKELNIDFDELPTPPSKNFIEKE